MFGSFKPKVLKCSKGKIFRLIRYSKALGKSEFRMIHSSMRNSALTFWKKHPALLFGLFLYLGALFALNVAGGLFGTVLLLALTERKLFPLAVLFFLLPTLLIYQTHTFPEPGSEVSGTFHIQNLKKSHGFSKGYLYRGTLKTPQGLLNCQIHSKQHVPANSDYLVCGSAHTKDGLFYTLKIKEAWSKIEGTYSLAELRYKSKEWVRRYIERRIPQKRAAVFLSGMATGELGDKLMQHEFGVLGLSHILAISGFHFAFVAFACQCVLRLLFPLKIQIFVLMCLITTYLFFIGDSPSVLRAWIFIMIFLLGQLIEQKSSPLNSLGIALCLTLLLNPLSAMSLSFQLSFLATAGILHLHTPVHRLLLYWIPQFSMKEVLQKNLAWQHGYLCLACLRKALALILSVHLTLLPLLLFHFHYFSVNSLIYNLFYPFLVTLGLFLFLIGIVGGPFIHEICGIYCDFILKIPEAPPVLFKTFYVSQMPPILLSFYLFGLLFLGIRIHIQNDEQKKNFV